MLDYQTQQLQLFPLLAASYVLDLGGRVHRRQFYNVQAEIEKGNFEPMQEVCLVGGVCESRQCHTQIKTSIIAGTIFISQQ